MPSYNKVLLMGNLTRDPELRYTANNHAVCNIGLAVSRRYKTSDGEQREEVAYIDCEMWGRRGEVINQYFSKGQPIFLEGHLRLNTWEDQQGQKHSKLRVVVENFEFISSKGGGGGDGGGGGGDYGGGRQQSQQAGNTGGQDTGSHQPIDEEDIPF